MITDLGWQNPYLHPILGLCSADGGESIWSLIHGADRKTDHLQPDASFSLLL